MSFHSEFSDFVQNPSISQPSVDIFKKSKHSLDLFIKTDNCILLVVDKCIVYFQKLEKKDFENSHRQPLQKAKKYFLTCLKLHGLSDLYAGCSDLRHGLEFDYN